MQHICAICHTPFESKVRAKYCTLKCRYKAANSQKYAKIAERAIQERALQTAPELYKKIASMQQEIYQLRAENRSFRAQLLAKGRN